MKNIILILLSIIPLLSGGQDTTIVFGSIEPLKFIPGENSIHTGRGDGSAHKSSGPIIIFNVITNQLLFEYETDCYNDSTVHYYEIFYSELRGDTYTRSCNKGDTLWHGGLCPEHWHHKQPTFPDFIKWIRKKTNNPAINYPTFDSINSQKLRIPQ